MRWNVSSPQGLVNVHSRVCDGSWPAATSLLASIAEPETGLWPADPWPPLRLNRGLTIGSSGGHGPIRYTVTDRSDAHVCFAFSEHNRFAGSHSLTVHPENGRVRWTHVLHIRRPDLVTQAVIVPLHDQVLEQLLDNAENLLAGRRPSPRRIPLRARARLALAARGRGRR